MRRVFILALCILPTWVFAQTVKNGSFENWQLYPYEEPLGWMTANSDGQSEYANVFSVTKVSDDQMGFAVKMETKKTGNTIIEAWISCSDGDPMKGEGGFPFTQKPDKFTFRYKAGIVGNDTNVILLVFKKNGTVFQMDGAQLPESKSTFTNYTINLSLSQTPDTILVAAAASNLLNYTGVQEGTWFIIDNMRFEGPGVTQSVPNGSMDNWVNKSLENLPDWYRYGKEGIQMTTDAYRGSKAISLETIKYSDGYVSQSGIRLSQEEDGQYISRGVPYTLMNDTLIGYYKYSCLNPDSAYVWFRLFKDGNQIIANGQWLRATSTYTKFSIPMFAPVTPDTLDVLIESSSYYSRKVGSKLTIDEVQLTSSPLSTTGLPARLTERPFRMYPNPCNEYVQIESGIQGIQMQLFSYSGQLMFSKSLQPHQAFTLSTDAFPRGMYFWIIKTGDGQQYNNKLLIE